MRLSLLVVMFGSSALAACSGTPPASPTSSQTEAPSATSAVTLAPTAEPTAEPTESASELQTTEELVPGRYYVDYGGYRYTFAVADEGWQADTEFGAVFQGEDPELAIFWPAGEVNSLYEDPCQSMGTDFDPGPSVEELADALGSLEGFESTVPTDVTVGDYTGKRIAITVPMDVDVNSSACNEGNYSLSAERWYQAPGQTDDMWILDMDGARQITVTSHTPATPPDVAQQLEDIFDSLVIRPI
jgi:hypothetical protein